MASTARALGSIGSPVERLRSLTDTDVTITTYDGTVTGSVLSCTRSSVWIVVGGDLDVVVPLDEILDVSPSALPAA